MPTKKQIDKARLIGAYVTELLTQHADLIDQLTIDIRAWSVFSDMTAEQARSYVEAFAERYGLVIETGDARRHTMATLANETFGTHNAVSMTVIGPAPVKPAEGV